MNESKPLCRGTSPPSAFPTVDRPSPPACPSSPPVAQTDRRRASIRFTTAAGGAVGASPPTSSSGASTSSDVSRATRSVRSPPNMGDGVVSRSALLQLSERFAAEIQVSVSADVHVNCQAALEGVPDRAAGIPRRGRRRTILTATDAAPATEWPWLFSVNSLHGSIAVAGVDGSVSAGRVPIVAGVLPPIIAVPLLGFGADIRVTCCRISDRLLARRRRERRRRWKGSFLRWRICAFICWRVVTLYEGDVGAVRNHYLDIGYVRGRTYSCEGKGRCACRAPWEVNSPPGDG